MGGRTRSWALYPLWVIAMSGPGITREATISDACARQRHRYTGGRRNRWGRMPSAWRGVPRAFLVVAWAKLFAPGWGRRGAPATGCDIGGASRDALGVWARRVGGEPTGCYFSSSPPAARHSDATGVARLLPLAEGCAALSAVPQYLGGAQGRTRPMGPWRGRFPRRKCFNRGRAMPSERRACNSPARSDPKLRGVSRGPRVSIGVARAPRRRKGSSLSSAASSCCRGRNGGQICAPASTHMYVRADRGLTRLGCLRGRLWAFGDAPVRRVTWARLWPIAAGQESAGD